MSPEIKRVLTSCSRGGRCALSPYVFQSSCISFDIINVDQGVPCSIQTHSPPRSNIGLSAADMIYADLKTWLCAIKYVNA